MFIRRPTYDTMRDELVERRTAAVGHADLAATQRTQIAFLVARVNQLEKERAIMLRAITKLEIPVPELAVVPPPPSPMLERELMAAMGSGMFEDMGDAAARAQGVAWDANGGVTYNGQRAAARGES